MYSRRSCSKTSPISRMMVLLALFAVWVTPSGAQNVSEAPWFTKTIGTGVTWKHYQFDSLYGLRQSVTVIDADLNNSNVKVVVPYLASSRNLTSTFVPNQYSNSRAAVNGTFFDTSSGGGGSTTYLRVNSSVITPQQGSSWSTEGALTISPTEQVRIRRRPSSGWAANSSDRDIIANGPVLVFNNTVQSFGTIGAHCTSRHPRTAMGTTSANRLLLVTVDGRLDGSVGMTCSELAQLMKDLGCTAAVSYDGGGSTTAWVRGQETNGVVNYPSDNGVYDHLGERSCSNAVAIVAPAAPTPSYDAQFTQAIYNQIVTPGQQQTVQLKYRNTGTQTWAANSVSLIVTRPTGRVSPFQAGSEWPAAGVAARNPVSVAPGTIATFTFTMTAPAGNGPTVFEEHFGLQHTAAGRIGPPDNEPRLKLMYPPEDINIDNVTASFYGANWSTGTSAGDKYGPDYRFKSKGNGSEYARFRPAIPGTGNYAVYEWHTQGANRTHSAPHAVLHGGGTTNHTVNQQTAGGRWNLLGAYNFKEGIAGDVRISDAFPDTGAVVMADAIKFRHSSRGALSAPVDVIVDNMNAAFTGSWTASTSGADRWRENYHWAHSGTAATATWNAGLPLAGNYQVQVWYSQGANRSNAAPYRVDYSGGSKTYNVNQTQNGGKWVTLGTHSFAIGGGKVVLNASNATPTVIIADAVRFVWVSN